MGPAITKNELRDAPQLSAAARADWDAAEQQMKATPIGEIPDETREHILMAAATADDAELLLPPNPAKLLVRSACRFFLHKFFSYG